MVGEVKAFHVKCKYTNALICTCTQGQPRSWLHCPRDREEYGAKAKELWKLYYSAREDQGSGEPVASTSTRSEPRSEPFLFRGMTREIAVPSLPPRFPLSEAKQTRGWSFGELRESLGDEKAMTLADSSFSARQWKQMSLAHGAPASVQSDDTEAFAAVVGSSRFTLEAAKRVLRDKLESVKGLEEKAARLQQDADAIRQSVERELMDEQRQQELGVEAEGTPKKAPEEGRGKTEDGDRDAGGSQKQKDSKKTAKGKKRERKLAVPRKRKRGKRTPRTEFEFDILGGCDSNNEVETEAHEEGPGPASSPLTPAPVQRAEESRYGGKALVSERLQLKKLQSEN